MTDDDKALVERLRVGAVYSDDGRGNTQAIVTPFMEEAADRIDALLAEIEGLKQERSKLVEFVNSLVEEHGLEYQGMVVNDD